MPTLDETNLIRLSFFLATLLFFLVWQKLKPHQPTDKFFYQRWPLHLGLTIFNSFLLKIVLPIGLVGFAHIVNENQWGLMHGLNAPLIMNIVLSLLLLDVLIYWQHRLLHQVPALWSLHRLHHSDLSLDCTSALRFHPIEMLLSLFIKILAILILGVSSEAVIIFEIILNSMAIFNHANIAFPKAIDITARKMFVTPAMHRIHHSVDVHESNHNFGFNLSIWDKIFNSYLTASSSEKITFGVKI